MFIRHAATPTGYQFAQYQKENKDKYIKKQYHRNTKRKPKIRIYLQRIVKQHYPQTFTD